MSIDTTKISDDEEATLAYTLAYIRFIKKSGGKSIEELLERELTEQIGRSHVEIAKARAGIKRDESLRRKTDAENRHLRKKNEDVERQNEALKRQLAVMDE